MHDFEYLIQEYSIDPLSFLPLHLTTYFQKTKLSNATGFIVIYKDDTFLVTNRHVLSGRDSYNQPISKTAGIPDRLTFWLHSKSPLPFAWLEEQELLMDDKGTYLWYEHSDKHKVDVAVLHINKHFAGCVLAPLDLSLSETDLLVTPSEPVSILGYPMGLDSFGKFPIWKTGHVASDIELDYYNEKEGRKQVFLIDATTKEGMSGSPVIAKRVGWYRRSSQAVSIGQATKFLGIYSGRISKESDIGMVWRPSVMIEVLEEASKQIKGKGKAKSK